MSQRLRMGFESFFLTRLMPRDHIPPLLRWVFRAPLFLERVGLSRLLPANVIILTTTGRRSGRPHKTPVEAGPGPRPGSLMVMAGWEGRTDWYRNARQVPCVQVSEHGQEWEAHAEPVPETEVAEMLQTLSKASRSANRIWSRWAGFEIDGTAGSYLRAAPHFPALYLVPIEAAVRVANVEVRRKGAIELLDNTRRETRALFRRLDPHKVVHHDARAWRARDVLGHMGAWVSEAARSLQAHADGGQYVCVDSRAACEAYNGRAADRRKAWAIEEVWTEYEVGHDELRKAVATMPAGKWDRQMVYPWNERGTVEALVKRMMKHEAEDHCAGLKGE